MDLLGACADLKLNSEWNGWAHKVILYPVFSGVVFKALRAMGSCLGRGVLVMWDFKSLHNEFFVSIEVSTSFFEMGTVGWKFLLVAGSLSSEQAVFSSHMHNRLDTTVWLAWIWLSFAPCLVVLRSRLYAQWDIVLGGRGCGTRGLVLIMLLFCFNIRKELFLWMGTAGLSFLCLTESLSSDTAVFGSQLGSRLDNTIRFAWIWNVFSL